MVIWIDDCDLFLHSKAGGDVHLWRCMKTKSVVPMVPDDFKDEGKVTNYLDLVRNIFPWDKRSYQNLIDYISPRNLLVNFQGLVIVELYKSGKDGKINEKEVPIYIRSLDVLSLSLYGLTDQLVPPRTLRFLEDKNGRAVPMKGGGTPTPSDEDDETLSDEAWMNGHTGKDWRSVEQLNKVNRTGFTLTVTGSRNTFPVEDDTTNVLAKYFYKIQFNFLSTPMKAVLLQDLIPNKEKARFDKVWLSLEYEGKMYVCRNLKPADRGV